MKWLRVSVEQVAHTVIGVLWHQRQAGAVLHPAFESYRREGKTFMMTRKERTSRYMPSIGPKTRKPAYASFEKNKWLPSSDWCEIQPQLVSALGSTRRSATAIICLSAAAETVYDVCLRH